MLALLKKDLFVLKKTCLIYLLMLLFYVTIGVVNGNFSMFQAFFCLLTLMLPVSSFSYDELAKWEPYGLSMPVTRRMIVQAKYLLTMCAMLFGAVASVLIVTLNAVVRGSGLGFAEYAPTVLLACLGLLVADFSLPFLFWLGAEKGRYAITALIWGIALMPIVLVKAIGLDVYAIAERLLQVVSGVQFAAVLAAATVVLTVLSVAVSAAIYGRKEFS